MVPIKIGTMYYVFWTCVDGHCAIHSKTTKHKSSLFTSDKREAKVLVGDIAKKYRELRARVKLGLPLRGNTYAIRLSKFKILYLDSIENHKAKTTIRTE